MPYCSTRSGRLYFDVIGDGRPLLLIHGFTNFGMAWAPQLAGLLPAGHRVILPDLRGHGRSDAARAPVEVSDLAADMADLLDHLGIATAVVCGLSLGGMVAQKLATEHSRRVSALVVACSAAFADGDTQAAVARWIEVLEGPDGARRRLDEAWPRLTNEAFRTGAAGRAVLESWRDTLANVTGASLAQVARGLARFDARAELASIRVPTRVVAGEVDGLFPPSTARVIADAVPGSEFVVLKGAGHLASLDSPDQFNRALLDFLARHSDG